MKGSVHKEETVKRVVSVCEAKDIRVWKIASGKIVRHILADSYQLVCPDLQISLFREASHPTWEILGENQVTEDCGTEMIRSRVCGENLHRVNWLFQQFVKINVIARSGLEDGDAVVIWDADTVPLRDIRFIEPLDGRLCCFHGRERHAPYFRTIEALLGFGRVTDVSFIAQCLPLRVGWLREMVAEIENRAGKPYAEAVLACLPGESGAEFSEYETIGSWMLRNHPDEIALRKDNRWLRRGSSVFPENLKGLSAQVLFFLLARFYHFVSIENWKSETLLARLRRGWKRWMRNSL
jgi:hypothetical protein